MGKDGGGTRWLLLVVVGTWLGGASAGAAANRISRATIVRERDEEGK